VISQQPSRSAIGRNKRKKERKKEKLGVDFESSVYVVAVEAGEKLGKGMAEA
jgi:hypothetical protein